MGASWSKFSQLSKDYRRSLPLRLLKWWALFEMAFYIYFRMRLRNIQPYSNPPPLLPNETSRAVMRKVWETFSVNAPGDGLGLKDFIR
jgi:hypothetical protein